MSRLRARGAGPGILGTGGVDSERGLGGTGPHGPRGAPAGLLSSGGFGVAARCQHAVASPGGVVTMVGRSSCGSRQTTWRRWSALRPWSLRGR